MKRWLKITFGVIGFIVLLFVIDIVCIFTINRPLFGIQNDGGNVYRGIFYDTYNCAEYSVPQIKRKGLKLACSDVKLNIGKVVSITDTSKDIENINSILEVFYEDDNYIYYFNGGISKYVIVKYENGYEEKVSDALKYGTITIDDLDRYNIEHIKYEKDGDYKLVSSLDKVNYADINILVMFNNKLYAKSNSVIDYAGGSKQIGIIDKVIDSKYIPMLNNETNTEDLLDAKVYDEAENSIVLEYNNEFVLFEKIDKEYELTFDMAMNCYVKVYEFKDGTIVYSNYGDIKYKTYDEEISIQEALDNKKIDLSDLKDNSNFKIYKQNEEKCSSCCE